MADFSLLHGTAAHCHMGRASAGRAEIGGRPRGSAIVKASVFDGFPREFRISP